MVEHPCILYIEDNLDNQNLVRRVLRGRGYTVQLADDGPSGLALARELTPALILVDINIPGLNGYEVTTRLRSMPHLHKVPIVALTADVSPGARERALVAGCDGYISKPISTRQLPAQLLAFIEGKREVVPPAMETPMLREFTQQVVERLEQRVRELMAANTELQEVDRLKTQFLASLSHELRTPLTSLTGYLDLFGQGTLGPLSDIQHEALQVMRRSVNTLGQQVNNLLYLQESRKGQLTKTAVQIDELLAMLVAQAQQRCEPHHAPITLSAEEADPIRADPSALEVALHNLLDNALKYTPHDGAITLTLHDEPGRVLVLVSDTGLGIPEDALEKIFLPFCKVDNSMASPQAGSGVGLALVRHIIEAHDGQITVRSTPGEGTTFTVVLPRTNATGHIPTANPARQRSV